MKYQTSVLYVERREVMRKWNYCTAVGLHGRAKIGIDVSAVCLQPAEWS